MNDPPLRIIFMGTPDFAVPSLQSLVESGQQVIWVVTQPDRPKGRGLKLSPPPVKVAALELGLQVVQPAPIKKQDFIRQVADISPDMMVVVAFGQILPPELLAIPRMGVINVHASLLPHLRGAAPIQWAILRGDKVTGVTTMLMDEKLDCGDILLSESVPILEQDTAGTLHDRLSLLGARLLVKTIEGLKAGTITPVPQDHSRATYAPMLKKSHGLVRWSEPASTVCRVIRGLDPWPGAFTTLNGKRLALFGCTWSEQPVNFTPGQFMGLTPQGLQVAAGQGSVFIKEVKLEGHRRMPADDFLRGTRLAPGSLLGTL